MRIILGIIIIAVGILFIIKTEKILGTFGRIAWFEAHLGTEGGSRLGYRLLGMFLVFLGMLITTNLINNTLQVILSPLLQYY